MKENTLEENFFNNEIYDSIWLKMDRDIFKLSDSQLYFDAKQNEIARRYEAARFFLQISDVDNEYELLTKALEMNVQSNNPIAIEGIGLIVKSYFYESALISYNIVVDLSWVLTIVSLEFVKYEENEEDQLQIGSDLTNHSSIENAFTILRDFEKNIQGPSDSSSPYNYFASMNEQTNDIIELVDKFWKDFSNTKIRQDYNYIKHRGTPIYSEIENLRSTRLAKFLKNNTELTTDIRDLQKVDSLNERISELYKFDNEKLFPYLNELITGLNKLLEIDN